MYPRVIIDINKLKNNLDTVSAITKEAGCSLMVVTKSFCADEKVVDMILNHPQVDYLADSRVQNLKTYAEKARAKGKETVLLRLPMESEAEEAVKVADVSLNSEITTIKALNEAAGKAGITHKVVLMIDLGDLREGIFYEKEEDVFDFVETALSLDHIELIGLGTNLTCYGAIIPKKDNLSLLVGWAKKLREKYGLELPLISGGNSSSIYLAPKGELPEGITNLRLGESFLLGNDTAYLTKIPGTTDETVILEAQVIECKEKPSMPLGEVGHDAFGHVPEYEDKGLMQRAIVGIGQQDVDLDSITPMDENISVLGASSDHLLLDVTHAKILYKVGDVVAFKLGYGGVLRTVTSPYVERVYR